VTALSYVYCLVRSARRPALGDPPAAMPDAGDLRAVKAGDALWAIVSTVPAAGYDEAALAKGLQDLDWVGRRAMAHEAVVEHFLPAAAVLPMQLFTLFTSDERALEHVGRDRARIDRILTRLTRQLEWGLRLSFDEQAARAAVETRSGKRAGKAAAADPSGTSYLTRKRDLLNVTRVQLTEARAEADRLYRAMSREATDARRRTATEQGTPGSRLLLDAAFLVPVRRSDAFRNALRRNARTLTAAGIVVSLTGPWPAYNFIDGSAPRAAARRAKAPARKAAKGASARNAAKAAPARNAAKGTLARKSAKASPSRRRS
jgi:hypothetical protein